MRALLFTLGVLAVTATAAEVPDDEVYSLYRDSNALTTYEGPRKRFHMATFDADYQAEWAGASGQYNKANCMNTAKLWREHSVDWVAEGKPANNFWCEQGREAGQ